jgi:hypothetical protein
MARTRTKGQDGLHGPTYWFVCLDSALEDGDWEEAARAALALRVLGIDIRLNLDRSRARRLAEGVEIGVA